VARGARGKLLAILRNPVDRCVSNYDMFLRKRLRWLGLEGERAHVTRTCSLWDEAVTHCRLADGFRSLLARWPRERLARAAVRAVRARSAVRARAHLSIPRHR
jgi:hypothetical protein